ncbi:MAG: hypothetical protein JWQ30_1360 [Sediminibacterium sp.]|nr:hypothetical protein [Sediminibacterium sp.]
MRRLSSLLLSGILLLAACKKDETPATPSLFRKWQWEYSGYGNASMAASRTNPSANTTVTLTLGTDKMYTLEKNGQQVLRDSFHVVITGNQQQLLLSHFTPVDQLSFFTSKPSINLKDNGLILIDILDMDNFYSHFFK